MTTKYKVCFSLNFLCGLLIASGCARLPSRPNLPEQNGPPVSTQTSLDKMAMSVSATQQAKSGFKLVNRGVEAFTLRSHSARAAGRSLDIQYYIWHNDLTGKLLAKELLEAADRGVRVRLLLDDLDARAKNFALAGLDAHPNIEVRLFNPFGTRKGTASKLTEMILGYSRLNHRMHNKAWIADNRIAIAGGRNIGDEYFSAGDGVNFIDLDFAIMGPAVDIMSASFNKYWNSAAVWPMATLSPQLVNQQTLNNIRSNATDVAADQAASPWIQALADNDAMQQIQSGQLPFHWTDRWQVLSDDPLKALGTDDPLVRSAMIKGFYEHINQSKSSIVIISPYFVPGKKGSQFFIDAAKRGPSVSVLTNSLASNDVVPVHGGYSKYRNRLIEGGVHLWELKPTAKQNANSNLTGSSGASLHSKSAVFDNETTFVGSFNLDPRSVSLNCEQGVFVTHPAMSMELATMFARLTERDAAWRVDHTENGTLRWSDGTKTYYIDPDSNFFRRLKASLFRWLPLDSQL